MARRGCSRPADRRRRHPRRPTPQVVMSFSPDSRWWWDGRAWVATTSPDGRWRWDGTAWTPTSGKAPGPGWARAIFGLGPIAGGLATGAIFWVPTHDLNASLPRAGVTEAGTVLLWRTIPLL